MSEEEIIEKINWAIHVNEMTKTINGDITHININVLQGLLDLYNKEKLNSFNLSEQLNKEKEKNKELEKYKTYYDNAKVVWSRNDYINKDKIKAKIEENKWAIEHYNCDEADYKQSQAVGAWNVLQRLLKESEIWNEKKID